MTTIKTTIPEMKDQSSKQVIILPQLEYHLNTGYKSSSRQNITSKQVIILPQSEYHLKRGYNSSLDRMSPPPHTKRMLPLMEVKLNSLLWDHNYNYIGLKYCWQIQNKNISQIFRCHNIIVISYRQLCF